MLRLRFFLRNMKGERVCKNCHTKFGGLTCSSIFCSHKQPSDGFKFLIIFGGVFVTSLIVPSRVIQIEVKDVCIHSGLIYLSRVVIRCVVT